MDMLLRCGESQPQAPKSPKGDFYAFGLLALLYLKLTQCYGVV